MSPTRGISCLSLVLYGIRIGSEGLDCSLQGRENNQPPLLLTDHVHLYPQFFLPLTPTDTKEAVCEESHSSSLAVEDVTEASVDLASLPVQLAGHHHLRPQIFLWIKNYQSEFSLKIKKSKEIE